MEQYEPASDAHAIDQAVLGVRLLKPSNDAAFHNAAALAGRLAQSKNLPGVQQLDPMSLMGRQTISPGFVQSGAIYPGLAFLRANTDGSIPEELTLERNAVTYRTRSYGRWSDVVSLVSEILCPVAAALGEDDIGNVCVVEFRCIDKFIIKGNSKKPLSNLIRPDTNLVCASLLDKEELLHSHIGWFQDVSEDKRTLLNVNIELSDDAQNWRTASILQVVSQQGSKQNSLFAPGSDFNESITDTFHHLHKIDKFLISQLLSQRLQASINLKGSSGIPKL